MACDDLTILCISAGADYADGFVTMHRFVAAEIGAPFRLVLDGEDVQSSGYVESVLDTAIEACDDGYVLRVDDDEDIPPAMMKWLASGAYREAPHWAFPRLNLWPDAGHYISNPPLYPDLQTRLSTKALSGGRREVHVGSPHGTGAVAPCAIHHHKFLVRGRAEREALVEHYESIQPGAGKEYVMFSVPERYEDKLRCEAL